MVFARVTFSYFPNFRIKLIFNYKFFRQNQPNIETHLELPKKKANDELEVDPNMTVL